MLESRRVRGGACSIHVHGTEVPAKVLVGTHEGTHPLGRLVYRRKANIKVDLEEIG
jgi:hypothetical protein